MSAAIVRRDDLDVLSAPPAVGLLILDARVRKMHLLIEVRQVVFTCPFANLVWRAIGPSIAVIVVFVALVQPALILALELVIQHDVIHTRAALQEPRLGLFVGAIDLGVVLQFSRSHKARVERLTALVARITPMFEETAT